MIRLLFVVLLFAACSSDPSPSLLGRWSVELPSDEWQEDQYQRVESVTAEFFKDGTAIITASSVRKEGRTAGQIDRIESYVTWTLVGADRVKYVDRGGQVWVSEFTLTKTTLEVPTMEGPLRGKFRRVQ